MSEQIAEREAMRERLGKSAEFLDTAKHNDRCGIWYGNDCMCGLDELSSLIAEATAALKDTAHDSMRRAADALRQPTQTDALREALDDAAIDEIILNFAGGIVRVASEHNPRGYVSYYRPREAMRAALQALEVNNG